MRICPREGFGSNWLTLRWTVGLKNLNYGIAEGEEDTLGLPDFVIQVDNQVVHESPFHIDSELAL